jgi:phage/plasmid-associated DNA primase
MISTETVQNVADAQANKKSWDMILIHAISTEEQAFAESNPEQSRKGSLGVVGGIIAPYNLVKDPDTRRERLLLANVAQFAIDFCHACRINGVTSFLTLPDDEHVHAPANSGAGIIFGRRHQKLSNLPTCDNLYHQGTGAALRLLNRILPNRSAGEAAEFLTQLDAALEVRPDLHFEVDQNVLTFKNNVSFVVNIFAKDPDEVFTLCPPIRPEDHILASSRLPVVYDPQAPESDELTTVLEGWSGPKDSDHYWLNIEGNFASALLPPTVDFKGIVINIGQGGAGMSSMQKMRNALIGTELTLSGNGHDLNTEFGVGYMYGKRAYYIPDASEARFSADTIERMKELSTNDVLTGKIKYSMSTVPVYGQVVIINSNGMPEFTQREARQNALPRRLHVIHHDNIFDDASVTDPSKRTKRSDLVFKVTHDEAILSDMLNRTMKAAAGMIVRGGYTPVAREIKFTRDELGEQDLIGRFLEDIGGIFGQEWSHSPRHFQFGFNDEMAVYAAFGMDVSLASREKPYRFSDFIPVDNVIYDAKTDVKEEIWPHHVSDLYPCHLINEIKVLYRLYVNYCAECGTKATMKQLNLKRELLKSGFAEIRVRTPFGNLETLIVPAGTPATKEGLINFMLGQHKARMEYLKELHPRLDLSNPSVAEFCDLTGPIEGFDFDYASADDETDKVENWLEQLYPTSATPVDGDTAEAKRKALAEVQALLHTGGVSPQAILSAIRSIPDTTTTTDTKEA